MNITKRITYSSNLSNWDGVMESCGVIWTSVCAVAWNMERCVMWNEVKCGLWDGMWNFVRCGMRQSVGCETARYVVVEVALCEMW